MKIDGLNEIKNMLQEISGFSEILYEDSPINVECFSRNEMDVNDEYGRAILVSGIQFAIIAPMEVVNLSFGEAKQYVDERHRHNIAPKGHKFSILDGGY